MRLATRSHSTHPHVCSKASNSQDADVLVCAVLPDADVQSALLQSIQRYLLYEPRGVRNPAAPCIQEDGICKSKYPKDFRDVKLLQSDTYLVYRRRDNGRHAVKSSCIMTLI